MNRLEKEIKLITQLTENAAEEARIEGRTEALEFIGVLIKSWRDKSNEYKSYNDSFSPFRKLISNAYEECAEMLEKKIEEFAGS